MGIILLSFVTGCDTRETTPDATYPQTVIHTSDETSECKIAIGAVATEVVSAMPEDESVDMSARFNAMVHYADSAGGFPDECNSFSLREMRPWMEYAGTLVWFCDTIDPNAIVDTRQELMGRTLGDWLLEYLIPCPIPD